MDELDIFLNIPVDGWIDCFIEPIELLLVVMDNTTEVISLAIGFIQKILVVISNLLSMASHNCSIPIKLVLFGSFLEVTKSSLIELNGSFCTSVFWILGTQCFKGSLCNCNSSLSYSNILCNILLIAGL
jgi:hypothetical protein